MIREKMRNFNNPRKLMSVRIDANYLIGLLKKLGKGGGHLQIDLVE